MNKKIIFAFVFAILLIGSFLLIYHPKESEIKTEEINKLSGISFKNITLHNSLEEDINFIYDDIAYKDLSDKNNFEVRSEFTNVKNGIKQDIYVRNNRKEGKYNFSIITEINYSKVRWNGKEYYLTDKQIVFNSFENELGNLVTPNIFFDDVFNKRINYNDVAEQGGYALAYEKEGKYYVELKIDNLNVPANREIKIDPTYTNQTDGFSSNDIGASNILGMFDTNGTDFWMVDNTDKFIYHTNSVGVNQSDGCSFATIGASAPIGFASNGSDHFIFDNTDNFIYHVDRNCVNQSDGFSVSAIGGVGVDVAYGVAFNNSDFFLTAYYDNFRYHTNRAGVNQTDGFSFATFTGITAPFGIASNGSDSWALDETDFFVYHLNSTGGNITDGFSTIDNIGAGSPYGIRTNLSDFWISDYGDKFIYHIWCDGCYTPPSGTITSIDAPTNGLGTNNNNIWANGTSISTGNNIQNISLYINGILNYSYDVGGISNFANLTLYRIVDDGTIKFKFMSCDDGAVPKCSNSTENEIYVDTIYPTIDLSQMNRSVDYQIYGNNLTLNWSVSDTNLANCSIIYQGIEFMVDCADTNISINITDNNYRSLNFSVNDTLGNLVSANASWKYKIFQNYLTYNVSTYESSLENFTISITFDDSAYSLITGNLSYNGINYHLGIGTTANTLLSKSLYAPPVTGSSNITFNFILKLTNSSESIFFNSSYYNQTIHPINIEVNTTCSVGLYNPICFDFKDEQNLSNIYTAVVNYNFAFGISNSTNKVKNGTFASIDHFCLCLNSTIYNNYTIGYGEIEYSSTGYTDRRYYLFDNQRLANDTIINSSLYMLLNTEATSFLFDFEDTSLSPIISKLASLMRWYPNLNEYKVVEMGRTDDKGETIMRVKAEDTDYRVGLYHKNGTLMKLLNPVRFACVTSPCTYSSLIQDLTSDYVSFFGVQTGLNYNETTELWTYTWNDPSQNTGSMRLVVERLRGDGSYTICDTSASGFIGILTCDSTGYYGLLEAKAYRTASPAVPIASKMVNTGTFVMAGALGLVVSLIIFLVLVLIGIWSPIASVVLGIVGLIPAYFFGTITLPILIGVGVLGGIIIHFMKRTG